MQSRKLFRLFWHVAVAAALMAAEKRHVEGKAYGEVVLPYWRHAEHNREERELSHK